jgi:hypothetical protein
MTISLATDPFLFERLLYCPQLIQESIFSKLPWEHTLAWSQVLRGYKYENAQIEQNTCALFPSGSSPYSQQQALRNIKGAVDSPHIWSVFSEQMGFEPGNRSRAEVIHLVKVLFRQAHLLGKEVPKSIAVPCSDIQSLNEHRRIAYGQSRLVILKEIVKTLSDIQAPNEIELGVQENPNSLIHIDSYVEWLLNWCMNNPAKLSRIKRFAIVYSTCHFLTHDICLLPNLFDLRAQSKVVDVHPEILTLSSLTSLNLTQSPQTALPPNFTDLRSLENLTLTYSSLRSLPSNIGNLDALSFIDLASNDLNELPKSFCNLSSLVHLILQQNRLTDLPIEFGNLTRLKELDLGFNELVSLPPSFCNLTSLKSLRLVCNCLSNLPDSFSKLVSLRHLNLNYNELITPREFIQTLTFIGSIRLKCAFNKDN